jgi:hypothetical protein
LALRVAKAHIVQNNEVFVQMLSINHIGSLDQEIPATTYRAEEILRYAQYAANAMVLAESLKQKKIINMKEFLCL